MAFARPFFRRDAAVIAAAGGAREVVILLDRSYSMGYGDKWSKALAAAQSTINSLTAADRGSVVLFGTNTEVALRSTQDKGRLQAAIAGAQPSASEEVVSTALGGDWEFRGIRPPIRA